MNTLNGRIINDFTASTLTTFTVHDIRDACSKQKRSKAVGLDGVAMEAIMHGRDKLFVHICWLFNMFLKFSFVPKQFMQYVIIPLVKNKSGDLSDVNNYRAIYVSTAMTKLFENTVFVSVNDSTFVDFQYGFSSLVKKHLRFKAKPKAKYLTFKAKHKSKYSRAKAKSKAKHFTFKHKYMGHVNNLFGFCIVSKILHLFKPQ